MKKSILILCVLLCAMSVFAKEFNVADFGAKGDGVTDNTEAFQKALDAAYPVGGTVFADSGNYFFKGHINVPVGVTLKGTYESTVSNSGVRDKGMPLPTDRGTCLLVTEGEGTEEGPAFITLNNSSTLKGVVIFYPNQKTDQIPTSYPWCVAMRGNNPNIIDCELLNPYNGIDATDNQRHLVRNVTGQPLRRGIYTDNIYDIGRWENIHWNPWFSMSEPLWTWQKENGEAFIVGRSDWHYITNCFCYGYYIGYRFIDGKNGPCNAQLLGIGADGCSKCVVIDRCNQFGLMFVNAELVAFHGKNPVMIEIGEHNQGGVVMFQNSSFWGSCDSNVVMKSGSLTLQSCNFVQWDGQNDGTAALRVLGGDLIVNSCRFQMNKNIMDIEKANSVIFSSNMAASKDNIKGKENTKFAESANIFEYNK